MFCYILLFYILLFYIVLFNFVSIDELSLDNETKNYLADKGIKYNTFKSIKDIIQTTDILYMTRIQEERFEGNLEMDYIKKNLYLTQELLTMAKDNMVIMHPLPRNDEITSDIDNDPRVAYFRQMENGLYVRMALLHNLLVK